MNQHKDSIWDGYTVAITQDEDSDWMAYFIEMPNISAFGDSPESALKELSTAWEAVKETYRERGEEVPVSPAYKNYSGSPD